MLVAGNTLEVKEVHAFDTYLQGRYSTSMVCQSSFEPMLSCWLSSVLLLFS